VQSLRPECAGLEQLPHGLRKLVVADCVGALREGPRDRPPRNSFEAEASKNGEQRRVEIDRITGAVKTQP
jgi:hypothetical protein